VLGGLLLLVAAQTWWRRSTEPPAWMEGLASATPRRAFRAGLVLAVANPKVVVMALAAGLGIGSSDLARADALAVSLAFMAVASLGVAVPYLAFVLFGARMAEVLARSRDWLVRNNAAVTALVLVALGLVIIVNGLQELTR
jgi:threonine/homoserine/homoserine lactone efflux protein